MLLFIGRGLHGDCLVFEFQNILCYCLSVAKSVHEPPFLKFQNILCYCLSKSHLDRYVTDYISKHLMLLFIFIFFPAATLPSSISKHLMLLFIRRRTLNRFTTDISKHLMLLFIPYPAFIILTEL